MRQIEKKYNLGGHEIEVTLRPDLAFRESSPGVAYIWGMKVELDTNAPLSRQWMALLHEIIEFINSLNDLGLTHEQISTIGAGMFQFLSDNRLLEAK